MKVSVVVPAFNEEKYIAKCIESLLAQIEPADEIIIVDNNSTDTTKAIANSYPVTVLTEKKQGTIAARDKGFNAAQYEIIARTDADTIVPPTWIKQIKASFTNSPIIALSGPCVYHPNKRAEDVTKLPSQLFSTTYKYMLGHDCIYGFNMAMRKETWHLVRKQTCRDSELVHEDFDLSIHLSSFGKIKCDNKMIVYTSPRRWKKTRPYFEYPYRYIKMMKQHQIVVFETTTDQIVKRLPLRELFK